MKIPLETDGPENTPPVGLPPVKTSGAAFSQIAENAAKLTVGKAFTVKIWLADDVQPFAFVVV